MAKKAPKKPRTAAEKRAARRRTGPRPSAEMAAGAGLSGNRLMWIVLAVILGVTAMVYSPVLKYGFTNWDDDVYVTNNPVVTEFQTSEMFKPGKTGDFVPLTLFSFGMEYKAYGEDAGPYHRDNLLLHLLNTGLVFWLVWLLSGGRIWWSGLAAALFALHPMHVESVAWITERKGLLYSAFFLASLISWLHFRKGGNRKWLFYGLSLVLFGGALLSKGVAVALPLVLLLLDYLQKRPHKSDVWIEKIPFFAGAVLIGLVAISAQSEAGALHQTEVYGVPDRFLIASHNLGAYVFKAIAPLQLSAFYPYPEGEGLPFYFFLTPLLLVAGGYFTYKYWHSAREAVFGLAFFTVTIALVLQFLPVGDAIMADRFAYLPFLGLFFAAGWGLDKVLSGEVPALAKFGLPAKVFAAAYLLMCAGLSHSQSKVWESSLTLWTDVLEKHDNVWVAHNNRGNYYRNKEKYGYALVDYENAIRVAPGNLKSYINRGELLAKRDMFKEAIADYDHVLELEPKRFPEAYNNRGSARSGLGDLEGALSDFEQALALRPQYYEVFANRGNAYSKALQWDQAVADYNQAIQFQPTNSGLYFNRGLALMNQESLEAAIKDFDYVLQRAPGNGQAYYYRAGCYFRKGDKAAALRDAQHAQSLGVQVSESFFNALQQ